MHNRTVAAMNDQDEECAERLRTMSNREIYEYLTEQVQVIGWVPQPWEVVGSPYIIRRFSGWRNALCRAGIYRRPTGPKNPTESRRYRREWRRQCELFEAEQERIYIAKILRELPAGSCSLFEG